MRKTMVWVLACFMLIAQPAAAKWFTINRALDTYVLQRGASPTKILFFFHGDEINKAQAQRLCEGLLQALKASSITLACPYRHFNNDSRRRNPQEVNLVARTVKAFTRANPNAKVHCVGHSAGGHSCVSASQKREIGFACVVAASSPLAPHAWRDAVGDRFRDDYDPVANVKRTSIESLLVIGNEADTVVLPVGWHAFLSAAERHGLNVTYKPVAGSRPHATRRYIPAAIQDCMQAYEREPEEVYVFVE